MGSFARAIYKKSYNSFVQDPIVGGPAGVSDLGLGVTPMGNQDGAVIDAYDTDGAQGFQAEPKKKNNPDQWLQDLVANNDEQGE